MAGEVLVAEAIVQYGCREDAAFLLYLVHVAIHLRRSDSELQGMVFS